MTTESLPAALPASSPTSWPALPLAEWNSTRETLHMWTQIVGKVRLALSPHLNQWWEVPLYVSARGLTTSAIPYPGGIFEIGFDFIGHELKIVTSRGEIRSMKLAPRSVADFYREFISILPSLGIEAKIWHMPVEIPDPIPFDEDTAHASYDPQQAQRFWRILVTLDTIFKEFRSGFIGKVSPIHFFWGSFDLAVTRFSGRRAPDRPGADRMTQEAYSQEESSAGWWPGGEGFPGPAFYSYTVPEPEGFRKYPVRPDKTYYDEKLGEYLLLYDDVRIAADPKATLMEFLRTTYEAGATLGKWDRAALERSVR